MCDASGCTECAAVGDDEVAYTLANGTCYHCSDANCSTCPSEAATCTGCKSKYALVEGAC